MTTTNDIMAQLEELWENAEPGPFKADDTVIVTYGTDGYAVRLRAGYDSEGVEHVRVLERAKPKAPEWEAVVASYVHDRDNQREVFSRRPSGSWESVTRYVDDGELVDPVPLVEMPERDELVAMFLQAWRSVGGVWPGSDSLTDAVLELLKGKA